MPGHPPTPTEDEIAAALAAIRLIIEAPHAEAGAGRRGWQDAAKLSIQHVRPMRTGVRLSWSRIERLCRAVSGDFYGVTGL